MVTHAPLQMLVFNKIPDVSGLSNICFQTHACFSENSADMFLISYVSVIEN